MTAFRKFTEEEFEFFKEKCIEYWELLSLKEFDLTVLFEDNLSERGAQCRTNGKQRQAQIILFQRTEIIKEENIYEYLEKTAIHEVAHILTCDYIRITKDNETDEETRISEAVSNRLAEAFYKIGRSL
jgi:predicted Zn-dependent protease with MMP-like domain